MASEPTGRKLAAILAADVVGFSRLAGVDEERTLARLRALRSDLIDPTIAIHRGRVVKRTGDGALVEFRSVVDAVRCALEIQDAMVERNAGLPPDQRIEFRIGIHLGDVVEESDGDLMGDGVNIAARLEGVAAPGGVALSCAAFEQVRDKVTARFSDLGDQSLKNIARPVRVYAAATGAADAAPEAEAPRPTLALPDKPSIAVLPFQNMSGDPEQEYFADGMVEEIITGLSRINWLFVIARNSSFVYKGKAVDVKRVGRELGVRYVLEGSVRKAGNRLRITSQLVEAESAAHLWADRFEGTIDDVFELQDRVTDAVVGVIEPRLRRAEIERARRKRPENLGAYDLVLRALPWVFTLHPDDARRALPLLESALSLESDYAAALGYAAWCHESLFLRAGLREENRAAMSRYARAALACGRDDATALTLAGFCIGLIEHDRAAAFQAFEMALALSPSSAFTYIFGSTLLGWSGEAERAIDWGRRALRLSPFDPLGFIAWGGICLGHFARGHAAEAAEAARKAIQVNPAFSINHMLLAAALAKLGKIDDAKAAAARAMELQPSFSINRQCAAIGCAPALAAALTDAVCSVGLPP
jgi:adenylate cyclase